MGSLRTRLAVLAAICVLAVGGAVAYLVASKSHQSAVASSASPVAETSLATVLAEPHIVFRNTNRRSQYGMVAAVSLTQPGGPRAITETECDRVYAAAKKVICLSSSAGVVNTYAAHVLREHESRTNVAADRHSQSSAPIPGRHLRRHHELHRRGFVRGYIVLDENRHQQSGRRELSQP